VYSSAPQLLIFLDSSTAVKNSFSSPDVRQFERLAGQPSPGIVVEFLDFLAQNKKWWLIPIVMALVLVGLMAVLGSTGAGPFVYTLF
jgi:hypothetical protein